MHRHQLPNSKIGRTSTCNYDGVYEQSITPSLYSAVEFQTYAAYAVSFNLSSKDEVADKIQRLCNNKASGEDDIPAEIYKFCVETLALWLHKLIGQAWRDEAVPDDWGSGIPVPVYKKRDKTRNEKSRGISLIDVAAKIFAIALFRRFQSVRGSRARPNQDRFRAVRGCANQTLTRRRIL
ncbi:unnamed protein product [Dibothriocephalus latus]|uniref:Reverse transcriptase domain-containing protein n=1 Tax=Dibothriocephalus latus TaxID=60516 RepID=A0A3P6TMU7_DIBLA|nr:unnamed protein product [Dibothriocephalus latus]